MAVDTASEIIEVGAQGLPTTVRYAGASGDLNPLHYDPAAAARAGFARVLVHGGWLAARLERLLDSHIRPRLLSVRFERPVLIGENLALHWRRDGSAINAEWRCSDERRVSATVADTTLLEAAPLDVDVVGDAYDWPVERGALRDFLAATGSRSRDVAAVPLAFLGNAARWTPAETSIVRRLGFAYDRLLHGSSAFELIGDPIVQGELLKVTEAHANRETRAHRSGGAMRLADTVHLINDADGRPRARVINRFIERPARADS